MIIYSNSLTFICNDKVLPPTCISRCRYENSGKRSIPQQISSFSHIKLVLDLSLLPELLLIGFSAFLQMQVSFIAVKTVNALFISGQPRSLRSLQQLMVREESLKPPYHILETMHKILFERQI